MAKMRDGLPDAAGIDGSHFRTIVETIDEAVYLIDRDRRIVYWNQAAERLTGYSAREVVGRACSANVLQHVDERGQGLCATGCAVHSTLGDGVPRQAQLFLRHKRGYRIPVCVRVVALRSDEGTIVGAAEIFSSLAPQQHEAQTVREAQRMAFEDVVTGLPNRRYVEKELSMLLHRVQSEARSVGVVMLDLDRFKDVNDQYGHAAGDEALRVVARTLASNVRPLDVVGRWGGEEFLLLFPDVGAAALVALSDRLRALVKRSRVPVSNGVGVTVTISGGATLVRSDDTPQTAIGRADALLYESKRAGRNRISHDLAAVDGDTPLVDRQDPSRARHSAVVPAARASIRVPQRLRRV